MNLNQTILGTEFKNPTVLASGIWGVTASGWKEAARHGAGAVTTKSIWIKEHRGHPNPTIIETEHWTLNAVGVPDAGVQKAKEEIAEYNKNRIVPLIVNIIAGSIEDFAKTAEAVRHFSPDLLEVNISCPNIEDEFGKPFACSARDAAAVTKAVKDVSGKIPVFVKLSPNVENITPIVNACSEMGVDGFTAINTVGPGMAIDLRSRMPILANEFGGISGPGIKPIAVKLIADVYTATNGELPIIGTGGVYTGEDAIELLLAGASLIGIGTAIGTRGAKIFEKVCDELTEWCDAEGIEDIQELIGGMHKQRLKKRTLV